MGNSIFLFYVLFHLRLTFCFYRCLFIKTWTLYRVWLDAEKFKKTQLTPTTIIKGIGAAVLVEIIFLIIWTVVDPPQATLHGILIFLVKVYLCEYLSLILERNGGRILHVTMQDKKYHFLGSFRCYQGWMVNFWCHFICPHS